VNFAENIESRTESNRTHFAKFDSCRKCRREEIEIRVGRLDTRLLRWPADGLDADAMPTPASQISNAENNNGKWAQGMIPARVCTD